MSELPPVPATRMLGDSDIGVSSLAWGMWRFAGRKLMEARSLVDAAFGAGITLFDTADIYGFDGNDGFGDAETLMGQVLAEAPHLRDRMVLATKGGIIPPTPYNSSRAYLEQALDASLRRLRTDRIDLYQIHRPDILTHPAELAKTLETMVSSGKVRAIGVSNYTPAQVAALREHLTISLATIQPEFSPLCIAPVEDGTLDAAMISGTAVLAWSPLGGGRIAAPASPREQAVAETLDAIAQKHGVSREATAYSWIMAHPAGTIPIVGSQNAERIVDAADAYKVTWTRTTWYEVLVASRGEKLP